MVIANCKPINQPVYLELGLIEIIIITLILPKPLMFYRKSKFSD